MRILLILLFSFPSIITLCQVKQDTLTNEKLVKMVKSGLSDILIIKSISTAQFKRFDLSSDGLIELKKNKVSDTIILTLFDKASYVFDQQNNNDKKPTNQPTTKDFKLNNSANYFSDLEGLLPGIYIYNTKTQKYNRLFGIKSSIQISTKGLLSTPKWFYEFNGTDAQTKLMDAQQEFLMVLGTNISGTVFEPSRFVLINVEVKKGKRNITLDNGALGLKSLSGPSSFSTRDGMIIPMYTEITENAYKISFQKKLPTGSYFFAPSQIVKEGSMEFFEFDVKK